MYNSDILCVVLLIAFQLFSFLQIMEGFNEENKVASAYLCTPSLVFIHGKDKNLSTVCGVSKNNADSPRFIPELAEKVIWSSYFEWLVLEDEKSGEFYVWNILSMEKVKLPDLDSSKLDILRLSSGPLDPQCRIVCISRVDEHDVIMLWKPGDTEFTIQEYDQVDQRIYAAEFFNGMFYLKLLNRDHAVIVADVLGSTSTTNLQFKYAITKPLPPPARPEFPCSYTRLIDAHNEFLFVNISYLYLSYDIHHIKVFRADFLNMAWVEIDNIGDRTIFLNSGRSSGVCCSAETAGTRANCIYFTKSNDPRLYVFDLEDRSFSTSRPCRINSESKVASTWIRTKNPNLLSKIAREDMACTNERLELVESSRYPNKNEDEDTQQSTWSDLLPEILSSILSRLFMGDSVAFRTICKSWQSTYTVSPTPDPLIHNHPYFMFLNTKTRMFNFYHPIYNVTYQLDIPEIYNADVRFAKDNWLIMSVGESDVFLFNPFTKTRIDLPDIPFRSEVSRMYFLSSPTSPDFEVFGFSNMIFRTFTVSRFKLGEEDWTHVEYESSMFRLAHCGPVMCNGSLYFLGMTGRLGICNLTSDDDPSWEVCVKARKRFKNSERRYLLASEGEIFSVFVSHDWLNVDVFKLDFKTMSWKDVDSIGDKMFFVSLNSSFSGKAVVRGAGNKVYFPRLHGDEGVFYSLKTKKIHNITSSFLKNDSQEEREIMMSTWVQLASADRFSSNNS